MGKRKNRSKAMCLAAKRRGGKDAGRAAGPTDALPESKQKITFGDDDSDDGGGAADVGNLRSVPPPPAQGREYGDDHGGVITLPRTNAPWFARTLNAQAMTHFEDYYRRQNILPENEWDSFLQHLRKPLPVTFRMSVMASHRHGVAEALTEGKELLKPKQAVYNDNGRQVPPPKRLEWCNGWQLGCDKMALKFSR